METKLLRLAIAGSVNEGKSSFVGRLLFESNNLYRDQLDEVERLTIENGFTGSTYDFSLFTDGLEFEQKNKITVDVAYRYLTLGGKKIVIADCPGHFEYNKNMVTACSTAQVLILVIDANLVLRQGKISDQTLRHLLVAETMAVPKIAIAITKIDLISSHEDAMEKIKKLFHRQVRNEQNYVFFSCSAFSGQGFSNVIDFLVKLQTPTLGKKFDCFEIQYSYLNCFFMCRALSGDYHLGQRFYLSPSGREIELKKIFKGFKELHKLSVPVGSTDEIAIEYAFIPESSDLSVQVKMEMPDLRRQLAVFNPSNWVQKSEISCHLFWFSEKQLAQLPKIIFKINSAVFEVRNIQLLKALQFGDHNYVACDEVRMNQIFLSSIELDGKFSFSLQSDRNDSKKFILIDANNFETIAFGIFKNELKKNIALNCRL